MNNKIVIAASTVAGAAVIALGAAWWLGLFDEPEAEVSLTESAALISEETTTTTSAAAESGGGAAAPTTTAAETTSTAAAAPVDDLAGTWQVIPSEATFVGYRVNEVLGGVGDFTAVGRTAAVTGELTGNGLTIEAVSITADLTQLASDNGGRDAQMRRQGLATDTFPDATFVLTEPIVLTELPAEGATISTMAIGDLTLHGVTAPLQFALDGQIVGGRLLVVGSTDIAMADFGIEPPQAPVVASVEDVGVMEFSLVFERG